MILIKSNLATTDSMLNKLLISLIVCVAIPTLIVALMITLGAPKPAAPLPSINTPFKSADFSDLPAALQYKAKDATKLTYRKYSATQPTARGSVVLVHGSSASGKSMHIVAKAFAAAGFNAYALDIRGHGESGVKGNIDYIGQLEDDLVAFVNEIAPAKPSTLEGFSSGGGFALRFAGSTQQNLFDNYLLMSPYISHEAPNYRSNSGGWVQVGVPRIIGLTILNSVGITALNHLSTTNFALGEQAKAVLTPTYSFALATNFQPQRNYENNIKAALRPVTVVAGSADEAFMTDKLEGIFRKAGKQWPVVLVPNIGHIALTLDANAVSVLVKAVVDKP
jgi:non-heme chloroperoxidase